MHEKPPLFIRSAGAALFGDRWQSDLARALGVSDATMRKWAAGRPLPDGVRREIEALCHERIRALVDALKDSNAA